MKENQILKKNTLTFQNSKKLKEKKSYQFFTAISG